MNNSGAVLSDTIVGVLRTAAGTIFTFDQLPLMNDDLINVLPFKLKLPVPVVKNDVEVIVTGTLPELTTFAVTVALAPLEDWLILSPIFAVIEYPAINSNTDTLTIEVFGNTPVNRLPPTKVLVI